MRYIMIYAVPGQAYEDLILHWIGSALLLLARILMTLIFYLEIPIYFLFSCRCYPVF